MPTPSNATPMIFGVPALTSRAQMQDRTDEEDRTEADEAPAGLLFSAPSDTAIVVEPSPAALPAVRS
jgi:hypothetical protein